MNRRAANLAAYLVSVIVLLVIGTAHVLDTTASGPISVETDPIVTFIVAASCPVHAG